MWTANLNTQLRAWLITSEKAGIGDEFSVFPRTLSTSTRSGRLVSSKPMIWLIRSKSCKLIWSILPGVLQGTDWKCLPNKKHSILTGTVTFQRVKQDQTQQLSNFLIVAKNANLAFNLVISWEENVSPLTSIDKICFTHVPTVKQQLYPKTKIILAILFITNVFGYCITLFRWSLFFKSHGR